MNTLVYKPLVIMMVMLYKYVSGINNFFEIMIFVFFDIYSLSVIAGSYNSLY